MKKHFVSMSRQKLLMATVLSFMLVFGATKAFATLTFSSTAITGTADSTIDVGADNALSLQTINNGDVVFGTGKAGIGVDTPTAILHLRAGTASASTAPLKFTAGTLTTVPESGAMEFDGDSLYFASTNVRRSVVLGNDIRVTDTVVTNTTTETVIHTSPIAANALAPGKIYKITLLGKTTTTNISQFFTLRFKMGGTTLITVPMDPKNVTDDHFRTEAYITIRTIGATGTYAAHVEGTIGDQEVTVTPITGSVDTTVSEDMVVTLQWDAANEGNVFTIMQAVLEVVG